jgi:predicted Zn-dependent protease
MTIMQIIILQPILFQPGKDIISLLEKSLSEEFNASSSIITASPIKEISDQLFDKRRKQWKSNYILQWLSDMYKPSKSTTKILALCDFDAYSGHLNFV